MKHLAIRMSLIALSMLSFLFCAGIMLSHDAVAQSNSQFAQAGGGVSGTGGTSGGGVSGGGTSGGGVSGTGGGSSGGGGTSLVNPLQSQSISEFLVKIIDVILIFAVPIIIFFIIYAGFMYVTARGDSSKISTAHSALTWAVVGGVITLGAKLIIEVIKGTIATF